MNKSKYITTIKSYTFYGLGFFIANYSLIYYSLIKTNLKQVAFLHIVIFSVFLIAGLIFNKVIKTNNKRLGSLFLSINFIRIIIFIIFLYKQALFSNSASQQTSYQLAINFFVIYFLYLYTEITLLKKN
jgi:hypothetical protein